MNAIDHLNSWNSVASTTSHNLCRLCCTFCDVGTPIFEKAEEKNSIYSKLKRCVPSILIDERDIKPKQICMPCVSKLESCSTFIETCLDSDNKFSESVELKVWDETILNHINTQVNPDSSYAIQLPNHQTLDNTSENKIPEISPHVIQNLISQDNSNCKDFIVLVEVKNNSSSSSSSSLSSGTTIYPIYVKKEGVTDVDEPKCKFQVLEKSSETDNANVILQEYLTRFQSLESKEAEMASNYSAVMIKSEDDRVDYDKQPSVTTPTDLFPTLLLVDEDPLTTNSADTGSMVTSSQIDHSTFSDNNRDKTLPSENDFRCTICEKKFNKRSGLTAHIARHRTDRAYHCTLCDHRFNTRWDLTGHLRIHSGEFTCEYCGKAFPARNKLERHRRIHTGERPYRCDKCPKMFSEKRNLHNHVKTHVEETTTPNDSPIVNTLNGSCVNSELSSANAASGQTSLDHNQNDVNAVYHEIMLTTAVAGGKI